MDEGISTSWKDVAGGTSKWDLWAYKETGSPLLGKPHVLDTILQDIADDITKSARSIIPMFLAEFTTLLKQHGALPTLYHQFVNLVYADKRNWPFLRKSHFRALNIITRLVAAEGRRPSFRENMGSYTEANKKLFDVLIVLLAKWCYAKITDDVYTAYNQSIKHHVTESFSEGFLEKALADRMENVPKLFDRDGMSFGVWAVLFL